MMDNFLQTMQTQAVWLPLDDGLIAVTGDDAETFLQGQLTNDVRRLVHGQAQYAGMCSPKGRLLASFLLWHVQGTTFVQMTSEIQSFVQKRLGMYILRSKVKLENVRSVWHLIGLAGMQATALLETLGLPLPGQRMSCLAAQGVMVVRLDEQRYCLVLDDAAMVRYAQSVEEAAQRMSPEQWRWLDIAAGIPVVLPQTQDEFVPQMVNFDLTHSVDFKKGCYTGQEIVARMQYLGRLKRRMYRVHADVELLPAMPVFSSDMTDPTGMIVQAAQAPEGGWDALAVVQISSATSEVLHAGAVDGAVLVLRDLPYAVGEPVV